MRTHTLDEFKAEAASFVSKLMPNSDRAVIVTLSGELGAGKTTFAQTVAQTLGVTEHVTSPTFVLEKIYQLNGKHFERLIHIDAYRLENSHELEVLGFKELLADPKNLILLEWPERVPDMIPKEAIAIRFDITGEERTISINDGKKG